MKFRNVGKRAKTFDGYKEEDAAFFSYDRLVQFAKDTGKSISEAYKELKSFFSGNQGGMPTKRKGTLDYRKGGMVINTTDNRKNK